MFNGDRDCGKNILVFTVLVLGFLGECYSVVNHRGLFGHWEMVD